MTVVDLYEIMATSRADIRKKVVTEFLNENAGDKNHTSRYEYNVEEYESYKIILKRPGRFKKGFDFTVNIRGVFFKKNKRYENPSFGDIVNILKYVKSNKSFDFNLVKNEINNIFNVDEYNLNNVQNISFKDFEGKEHPVAIILLAIKWLFISEDIAYWNWSGRNMFMGKLQEENLV